MRGTITKTTITKRGVGFVGSPSNAGRLAFLNTVIGSALSSVEVKTKTRKIGPGISGTLISLLCGFFAFMIMLMVVMGTYAGKGLVWCYRRFSLKVNVAIWAAIVIVCAMAYVVK